MSRSERLTRARAFHLEALARDLSNGQIARWLKCSRGYVRQLRTGARALNSQHRAVLGARGFNLDSGQ